MKRYTEKDSDYISLIEIIDELPLWSAPFGLKLLQYINYKKNIKALDIGYGLGFPLTEIALRLGGSSIVYGIDPMKENLKRVMKKIKGYRLNNIKILEGAAENIPLENETIDLITSNNAFNNVSDLDKVLSECRRISKSGCQLIHTMNTDLSMIEFYNTMQEVLSSFGMNDEIKLMHEHIAQKRPSVKSFISRLNDNGFLIKDIVHDQFDYKFADGTAMLNHYFIRLAFMDSWIKLIATEKVNLIFDNIESRLNEQSNKLGELKLSIPFVLINALKI